ncbi:uncharacterized protein LOC111910159 isoform X3 [Lactuca sativa]|uniref:uncharacterized protein LOC111910159 isoform X3 n=1 Tax=Lactuca sativa TaxID=4236 RepID=UPI001C688847|nr:uncharacterized protein LOC111910159 isoform X3 [Lactuca sativa]
MKLPTWIGGRRPILMSTRPPPFDANLSGDMISINGWQATGGSSRELSPEEEMLIIHSTSMAAEPLTKGKGGHEVGLLLWNSRDAIFSLFEELLWVYKLVSPLKLGMAEATRVCNALALVQRPLVLKFTLWISSLTVERFNFTEGTQPDRRYLVVFMMVIMFVRTSQLWYVETKLM